MPIKSIFKNLSSGYFFSRQTNKAHFYSEFTGLVLSPAFDEKERNHSGCRAVLFQ